MNVEKAVMQVDYWDARSKYFEYRELVKSNRAQPGDDELRRAYREISRGEKVIDVNVAIAGGGLNAEGLPHLAIARADWPFVRAWWDSGRVYFTGAERIWRWKGNQIQMQRSVGVRFPNPPALQNQVAGRAQVPSIPPAHRPKGSLSGYRILFEAVWQRVPPVDPILLRHVGGPFYVVLAQWDLSALEQAVLRARL